MFRLQVVHDKDWYYDTIQEIYMLILWYDAYRYRFQNFPKLLLTSYKKLFSRFFIWFGSNMRLLNLSATEILIHWISFCLLTHKYCCQVTAFADRMFASRRFFFKNFWKKDKHFLHDSRTVCGSCRNGSRTWLIPEPFLYELRTFHVK